MPAELKSKIAALEQAGWQRQFTTDQTRLEEMVEFYQSLGYEVLVESACDEPAPPECSACYEEFCGRYMTIYVRRS